MVLEQAISSYIQEHPHTTIDIESRKLAARLKSHLPETEDLQRRLQKAAESQSKRLKPNPALPKDGH